VIGKIDLDDVLFAISLDSLGRPIQSEDSLSNGLLMHVSRPPKEGQHTFEFLRVSIISSLTQFLSNIRSWFFIKNLEKEANKTKDFKFDLIHKKINLASEQLAWEHERFSLNKIPALTLSHFQSHKDTDRVSMTDTM
jgi:hypothetical protein